MSVQTLLAEAQAAGLSLWLDGERIRWRCSGDPPGDLLQRLSEHKPDLLSLLTRHSVPMPDLSPADEEAVNEAIEERAAIREFDGGETRETAEREARSAMRVYRVLVAMRDNSPKWVTMIAPGCTLAQARRDACLQFGAERVLGTKVNQPARGKQWAHVQCSASDD